MFAMSSCDPARNGNQNWRFPFVFGVFRVAVPQLEIWSDLRYFCDVVLRSGAPQKHGQISTDVHNLTNDIFAMSSNDPARIGGAKNGSTESTENLE